MGPYGYFFVGFCLGVVLYYTLVIVGAPIDVSAEYHDYGTLFGCIMAFDKISKDRDK